MLFEILSDLVKIENVLFIIKNDSVTSEIRSNSLNIKKKENWITIGENDDPAHFHINSNLIKTVEFFQEEKETRTSFSVRFFDVSKKRVLAAFFTKMYEGKNLKKTRQKEFENLRKKYGPLNQL